MDAYWETTNGHAPHSMKYESEATVPGYTYCGEPGLNFSTNNTTYSEDDGDFPPGRRGKTSRQDPLSHRIIEKRRRDRMNSCLADLSRLIPQQYMRKGRGRVEKTEIIEMAIRHLKNLQNQECGRETSCGEQYRLGYNDCLTEAAKFMLHERGEEMCYRMVAHLKEHCNEIMKGELMKSRCGVELTNGGSPLYLTSGPIGQHLRDMLTCPSDMEHSSNDHHDVKDLSFRSAASSSSSSANSSNANPPAQAAVITSTAPSVQHLDTSSNHSTQDYDAPSPPARNSSAGLLLQQQDTNNNLNHHHHQHESVLRTMRMRKYSEHASPEHDSHSHNSYKFKNYIQQRFSQDTHENGSSTDRDLDRSPGSAHEDQHHHHHHQHQQLLRASPLTNGSSSSSSGSLSGPESKSCSSAGTPKSSTVASSTDEPLSLKRKMPAAEPTVATSISPSEQQQQQQANHQHHQQQQPVVGQHNQHHHHHHNHQPGVVSGSDGVPLEKKQALGKNGLTVLATAASVATDIKHELPPTPAFAHHHSSYQPVPIFACHTQGFYVPLNVDYETLLPYLNGIDLLNKSFLQQMPPLHPISISVNYSPAIAAVAAAAAQASAAGANPSGSLLMKASTITTNGGPMVNGLHNSSNNNNNNHAHHHLHHHHLQQPPQTKSKLVEGIVNGC